MDNKFMRRTLFSLIIAFLTFGIGSIVDFKFYQNAREKAIYTDEAKIIAESEQKKNFGTGFGTGYRNFQSNKHIDEPKLQKLTCSDKNLLSIWNELRKDKIFKEREKEGFYQTGDCSKLIEVERIDLNGDGQKESIIWGNYTFSGATGNHTIWIYEKRNGKFKQLLQFYAYKDASEKWFEIKRGKTKNFHNLLIRTHYSGYETTHSFFKFNGSKYIENKCWFEIWVNEEIQVTMSCKEYNEQAKK